MPLNHTYHDAYLAPIVTEEREARAVDFVADLGTLPAAWVARLQVLRAYVIVCLESNQSGEDLFAVKLRTYQSEFDSALRSAQQAQAAIDAAAGGSGATIGGGFMVIPLERA